MTLDEELTEHLRKWRMVMEYWCDTMEIEVFVSMTKVMRGEGNIDELVKYVEFRRSNP